MVDERIVQDFVDQVGAHEPAAMKALGIFKTKKEVLQNLIPGSSFLGLVGMSPLDLVVNRLGVLNKKYKEFDDAFRPISAQVRAEHHAGKVCFMMPPSAESRPSGSSKCV